MPTYLSRLLLNPLSPSVQRDMADCYRMHQRVLKAFPEAPPAGHAREKLAVLYRLDPLYRSPDQCPTLLALLVQSMQTPDWSDLPARYLWDGDPSIPSVAWKDITSAYDRVQAGDILTFRLRCNPTRKVDTKSGEDGQRRNGRRVGLTREADQLEWLRRKAKSGGFEVLSAGTGPDVPDLWVGPEPKERGTRRGGYLTFNSVLFEGHLRVTDAKLFQETLRRGVGSGKAYGFGLLSIAPA